MVKLAIEHFSSNKPLKYQAGYYYVIPKDTPDLSKVKIAHLSYPTKILNTALEETPHMWLIEDEEKKVSAKDFLFGPEVVISLNAWHLELLFEATEKGRNLMFNFDYLRLKDMYKFKMDLKDYGFKFGKGLLEIEEREPILID